MTQQNYRTSILKCYKYTSYAQKGRGKIEHAKQRYERYKKIQSDLSHCDEKHNI